jgi:hypothetical protein
VSKRTQKGGLDRILQKKHDRETPSKTGVSPVMRGAARLGIAVAKGDVPITAVQRRELYSDRELRRKAGWFGQGS